jgi:hypothetical protein
MASEKERPLEGALTNLEAAIVQYRKRRKDDPLPFLALTKAFEVAVEYAWRHLKKRVEDEGLDCPSPKAAVREAARLGFISDPSLCVEAINARNASVHDDFGIGEDELLELAEKFLRISRKEVEDSCADAK